MKDTMETDWQLLDRYLAGEATPEEVEALERWADAAPGRRALLAELGRAAHERGATAGNVDAAWLRLKLRMQDTPPPSAEPDVHPRFLTRGRTAARGTTAWRAPLLRAAAVVLLALAAVALWRALAPGGEAYAVVDTRTGRGEQRTVQLPDGSEAVLDAESRLRYPARFDDSVRIVELEGGAYFRVAHDPEQPFVVRSGPAETRVLGTEFEVQAYDEQDAVRVVVADGRVSLRARAVPGEAVILERGGLGRVTRRGGVTAERDVALDAYLGWLDGWLVFEDVTLAEAVPQLERRFDLEFRVTDPALAGRRLTARVQSGSLERVLESLALALDAGYVRTGDTITLYPNGGIGRSR